MLLCGANLGTQLNIPLNYDYALSITSFEESMNRKSLGLVFTLLFVTLESGQFVYFGGLFQKINSFLFGFLVFGLIVITCLSWTIIFNPGQLKKAFSFPKQLLVINLGAIITFTAYLMSVQMLEPAITYTISAGTMPITAYILFKLGVREGEAMRNYSEAIGNVLIFCSIIFLSVITAAGLSGFIRGDRFDAVLGILLAIVDGVFFTGILVYSQRMSKAGLGAVAVLGLRLPLYVLVTGAIAYAGYGYSPGQLVSPERLMLYVIIGFLLTIPPLYFLQKAVTLLPTLTISALTALGPFVIFSLQLIEGRIEYSFATMTGLAIYVVGALLSAFGAVKATKNQKLI